MYFHEIQEREDETREKLYEIFGTKPSGGMSTPKFELFPEEVRVHCPTTSVGGATIHQLMELFGCDDFRVSMGNRSFMVVLSDPRVTSPIDKPVQVQMSYNEGSYDFAAGSYRELASIFVDRFENKSRAWKDEGVWVDHNISTILLADGTRKNFEAGWSSSDRRGDWVTGITFYGEGFATKLVDSVEELAHCFHKLMGG